MGTDLHTRHCVACTGDVPRLDDRRIRELLAELPAWSVEDGRLQRQFTFRDFAAAMRFVNRMAETAELEQHHPDFAVHYSRVDVTVWTHTVGGLTENDFVLAARIGRLVDT